MTQANPPQTLLVTGATGFVGSHFIYHVLQQAPGTRVFALVRAADPQRATQRLHNQLATVAAAYYRAAPLDLSRLQVLVGDIVQPLCGLGPHDLRAVSDAGPVTFFHMAASLAFDEARRAEIMRVNVGGTANVLRLARSTRAACFVYVSTAYSCGKLLGDVPEQPVPRGTVFNNAYELAKARAEQLSQRACRRWGMACQIVRPAIVVGVRSSYRPGGAESGLYGFVLELLRLKRLLQRNADRVEVLGDADCELNLVPIDALTEQLWTMQLRGYPGGNIHHLTSSFGPRVDELLDVVAEECELPALKAVVCRAEAPTPLETLFDRRMLFYSSYLRNPKRFIRRDGIGGGVATDDARLLIRQAVVTREAKRGRATLKRDQHRSFDGFPLNTYEGGNPDGPPLILVNALGVPADIFEPLFQCLAPHFRVITWESRGVPSWSGQLSTHAARFEAQEADLLSVANKYTLNRFHLAGYCTGADLAFQIAGKYPRQVLSVAALNGAFLNFAERQTPFQQSLWQLVPLLAASRKTADFHQRLVFGHSRDRRQAQHLEVMVNSLDPALFHLTSLPFQTGQTLHHYALLLQGFAERRVCDQPPRCPTLVMTSTDDPITHPDASIKAARTTGADLHIFDHLGHFGLYTSPDYQDRLLSFLLSSAQARVA